MMLITIEEAQEQVRADGCDDEALINMYIKAASAAIYTYLGDNVYADGDKEGEEEREVREDVKAACMMLTADFYKNREGLSEDVTQERFGYGYLPRYIVALLFPYRKLVSA